jgi:hypothetical protein
VRPWQARYQAALRPDKKGSIDSRAISKFVDIRIPYIGSMRTKSASTYSHLVESHPDCCIHSHPP